MRTECDHFIDLGLGFLVVFALAYLARRWQALTVEIDELDGELDRLTIETVPTLRAMPSIGTRNAAALLIAAGDNPDRLASPRVARRKRSSAA